MSRLSRGSRPSGPRDQRAGRRALRLPGGGCLLGRLGGSAAGVPALRGARRNAGYRDLLGAGPGSEDDLGAWLAEGVLNPSHALFREPTSSSPRSRPSRIAPYTSPPGCDRRRQADLGRIAAALGRPETSMTHVLDGLERAGFVERADDVLRAVARRSGSSTRSCNSTRGRPAGCPSLRGPPDADAWRDARHASPRGSSGPRSRKWPAPGRGRTRRRHARRTRHARGLDRDRGPGRARQLELDVVALDRATPARADPRARSSARRRPARRHGASATSVAWSARGTSCVDGRTWRTRGSRSSGSAASTASCARGEAPPRRGAGRPRPPVRGVVTMAASTAVVGMTS